MNLKKESIFLSLIIGGVCLIFFAVMFMQFKTIEETDIMALETMRETELRTAISEWKTKYEETQESLINSQKSIKEYQEAMEKNEEASDLIDKDLKETEMILGKTNVYGEGVVVTLSDNSERTISSTDLINLINELRYAGAEAISINDTRIINTTEIVMVDEMLIIGGHRVSSPYVVKAIGNQDYLSSMLNLKGSGYIDTYTSTGKTVTFQAKKNIEILKYNGEMELRYINEAKK